MNWLDIVIIICLAGGLLKGLFDGFVKQVISFLALIVGIVFAKHLAFPVNDFLSRFFTEEIISPPILMIISYILAFILIVLAVNLVGNLISMVIKATPIRPLNMLLGAFFGFALWALTLSIIINGIAYFDKDSELISKQTQERSVLYTRMKDVIPVVYPLIKDYWKAIDKEKAKADKGLIVGDYQQFINFQFNNDV
ncbi:CvpA family protein [Bacteroidales bacterium OttesenSCG-928-M06]|nr:CvpA family protein [Bacteroidales bacterium OttesenSCG-928-M06]